MKKTDHRREKNFTGDPTTPKQMAMNCPLEKWINIGREYRYIARDVFRGNDPICFRCAGTSQRGRAKLPSTEPCLLFFCTESVRKFLPVSAESSDKIRDEQRDGFNRLNN